MPNYRGPNRPGCRPIQAPKPLVQRGTLLTIELVPESSWFDNVRSHVAPEDWDRLKKETSFNAGGQCELCGGRGPKWPVECHEVWEYDDERHIQRLVKLIALCPACHEVKHFGFARINDREVEAAKHLAKTNGWTLGVTERYIEVAFSIWRERSKHEWKLDLSWLEKRCEMKQRTS